MEKEALEIIDTAVKIGLGALISGASAYLITISKFGQEKEKDKRENTLILLKDISLSIEAARYKLEEAAHPFWHQVIDSESTPPPKADKQSIDFYLEAISLIGQARAQASLLRLIEIRDHLDKVVDMIQQIYVITASKGGAIANVDEINTFFDEIEKHFIKCFNQLGDSYCTT